ncbi:MAG TPA: peptide deformylase [Thermoflexales bacterium]|nr:peptide deformylase [Thermoflexales bacterium]
MIRQIRKIGDPVLRRKAKKVEKVTPEIRKLIDDMLETMRAQRGIGLAAPQVGIALRVAVVEIEKDEDTPGSGQTYVLVNPELAKTSAEEDENQEGCLSIPGWRGMVQRPSRVTVRAMDREGNRVKIDAEGYVARAFQHEIDHLDGVLFTDKLTAPDRIWRVDENAPDNQPE